MPKEIKIYNTLDRKKVTLEPITKDTVKLYSCGPTVYNFAHIGNLRTYIFMDILRKTLKYDGYKLKSVMNITDVGHLTSDSDTGEDKLEKSAKEQNKDPYEIAAYYTNIFFNDFNKLNIEIPDLVCKATDHIDDMIKFVENLIKNGYAYETNDGIYFDTDKFENYGSLSGQKRDELKAGSRVEINNEKKNPRDFALWKKAEKNHIMQWPSPWGMGYPGWHIECSVMSQKYLGDRFDIHTGGVDHIPVHHENEIAQNEAYCGHKTVNNWMHAEFMLVNNGKMSKSLGNVYTIAQLEEKKYSPMCFRYFCLNTHYRKKLNFTFDALESSKTAYNRLLTLIQEHKNSQEKTDKKILEKYLNEFDSAINDDLNTPLVLGILWTMLREKKSIDVYNMVQTFDKILSLNLNEEIKNNEENIPKDIIDLCQERFEAKKEKNYVIADEIRKQVESYGYSIIDKKDGFEIIKF